MKQYKRIFLIVLDSLGIGEANDAAKFGDIGANTLGHVIVKTNVLLPNLKEMGFLNLVGAHVEKTNAYYTKANEVSDGKDTLTGHLEMMGVITDTPFRTFTETGFPEEIITKLETFSGRKIIGNCNASGTEIIDRLGAEQMDTGALIVYTSADSVLQIAAHEEIIPVDELYRICAYARELTMSDTWKLGRIIARPYTGTPGNFVRTSNRHDYALNPANETVLDHLKNANYDVISIGKISDIFNDCGITKSIKTKDNIDGINKIIKTLQEDFTGLCFANLNDFDSKYGHRRDPEGYAKEIAIFDSYLPEIIRNLNHDDLLIITADHGNDPTYKGTNHTREKTPILIYNNGFQSPRLLPEFDTFATIGATIADNFDVDDNGVGKSILGNLQ